MYNGHLFFCAINMSKTIPGGRISSKSIEYLSQTIFLHKNYIMKKICLFLTLILFCFSQVLFSQGGIAAVELSNASNLKIRSSIKLNAASLTSRSLSASVKGGVATLKKGFVLCKVRNSKKGLPNFIVIPKALLSKTKTINVGQLMSKSGFHGFRMLADDLPAVDCGSCSDPNGDACTYVEEPRDDGKTLVYCSGCCDVKPSRGGIIAIPTYTSL